MTVIHPIAERTPRAEDSNVINCQKRGWRFGLWLFPLKVFLPSNFSSPNLATWHIFCFRVWKYSFNQHLFGWSGTLKWSECNFVSKFLDYVLWHTTISRWTRTMLRRQTTTSLAALSGTPNCFLRRTQTTRNWRPRQVVNHDALESWRTRWTIMFGPANSLSMWCNPCTPLSSWFSFCVRKASLRSEMGAKKPDTLSWGGTACWTHTRSSRRGDDFDMHSAPGRYVDTGITTSLRRRLRPSHSMSRFPG